MRPLLRTLVTVATGALLTTVLAAPASAVPTQTLNPAKLPRGADIAVPHVDGTTVVDGSVRFTVPAPVVRLLGKSGTAYVVATAEEDGSGGRIYRYDATGAATLLGRADAYASKLSGDGGLVVSLRSKRVPTTVLKVRSATTGALVATRSFDGYLNLLDAQGSKVLVAAFEKSGTQLWDVTTDTVTTVTRRAGQTGDLSLDLLASYTKDPYRGGCTVLTSISKPGKRIWQSCTDGIVGFSTDGSRIVTTDIMADGIGPSAVLVRTVADGRPVGSYKVQRGWFGQLVFESPTALLLETNGPHKAAVVRCDRSACERASEVRPAETPRAS